jgi:3-oxoacyl-[acyl-carrier protein] reductase
VTPSKVWNQQAFEGLRLVIAGGCGGIGRHLVGQAADLGARVCVLDLPESIARYGQGLNSMACLPMDGKDHGSVQEAMDRAATKLGGIDACVNLVGYMSQPRALADTPSEVWQDVMRGNLDAAFFISRAALPHLHQSARASLLHVASGLGSWARPMFGAYGPAKAGMILMVRELALENAPRVRVNAVAPGAVDTAFLRGGTGRSDESAAPTLDPQAYGKVVPLGRMAVPQDVTDPILFLISPAAGYITGQTLQINGGTFMP